MNPSDIMNVPTAVGIPAANLGLIAADDVDALSYGIDFLALPVKDIRFSVDPAAVGVPKSAVNVEAGKVPNEAHGDEFRPVPPPPAIFGGTNLQVLDESGDTGNPFPLLISDDVDSLTEPPTSFVDVDSDGIPDSAVSFSLTPGSPSLTAIGAGPADISSQ